MCWYFTCIIDMLNWFLDLFYSLGLCAPVFLHEQFTLWFPSCVLIWTHWLPWTVLHLNINMSVSLIKQTLHPLKTELYIVCKRNSAQMTCLQIRPLLAKCRSKIKLTFQWQNVNSVGATCLCTSTSRLLPHNNHIP